MVVPPCTSSVSAQRLRIGSCCVCAVQILALSRGHQFVTSPNHAVTVAAVVVTYIANFSPLK